MDLLAPEQDDVYGAVWLATAALTYEALHDAEGSVGEGDASFRQVDIREAAQQICSQKVHSARISQWANADHEENTHNHLREVGTRRRLTAPGECSGHRERPDLAVDDATPVLKLPGATGTVTYRELTRWVREEYPDLVRTRPVDPSAAEKDASAGAERESSSGPSSAPTSEDRASTTPIPMESSSSALERLYRLLALLPRHDHSTPSSRLPENGVYLFFERGETIRLNGWTVDRVIRVGTHRADGNFRGRIRQHYGNRRDLGGHKNSSIFRKHLGGALLRASYPRDERLDAWLTRGGRGHDEVEKAVSRELRGRFTFVCFEAPRQEDRMSLERGLVGLLSREGTGGSSSSWLGRKAANRKIQDSGLWNTQHTGASPLSDEEFEKLEELIRRSARDLKVRTATDDRLVVVPCGKQKIWDDDPDEGPVAAEEAYTSWYADLNREYARQFGDAWLVLSAKYGLLAPVSRVPGPYDVTFKRSSSGPVPPGVVRDQAEVMDLGPFDEALLLGGEEYRDVAREALDGRGVEVEAPLAGVSLFDARSALKTALATDDPFPV